MPAHDWSRVLPGTFHAFHHYWVGEIGKALNNGVLPPSYSAYPEQVAGDFGPDVLTLQERASRDWGAAEDALPGAVAVAEAPPQVDVTMSVEVDQYAKRQRGVVVRHTSGDRVIAVIEVVSPGNKSSANGLRTFVEKASALVARHGVHLLVLDLLPPTERDPQGMHAAILDDLGQGDYHLPPERVLTMASYRAGSPVTVYVGHSAVGMVLRDMPLFLTPGYYVNVPLEATYQAAWVGMPRGDRATLEAT